MSENELKHDTTLVAEKKNTHSKSPTLAEQIRTLGEFVKTLEDQCPKILDPSKYTILRVDGHCFSTFTQGFHKPCDIFLTDAMVSATEDWLKAFRGIVAYTQSDEVTMLLPPATYNEATKQLNPLDYSGRVKKFETLSAGMFSANFNYQLSRFSPNEREGSILHDKMTTGAAYFDCRAFQVDSLEDAKKVFKWRMLDAFRNGISALARSHFSSKQMHKHNINDLIKMLKQKSVDVAAYPTHLLHGSFVKKDLVSKKCIDKKTNEEVDASRTITVVLRPDVNDYNIHLERLDDVQLFQPYATYNVAASD
jgi:tRNA(His) guanylyltransferase